MFEQFAGLPAHPLLVHAAVVFVPLLALGAVVYGVVPAWRFRVRWPVALLAVAAAGAVVAAHQSGQAFEQRLRARNLASAEILQKLVQHQRYGDATMYAALGLAVATLVFVLAVPGRPPGDDFPRGGVVLQAIFAIVLLALSAASVYYVVRTGDSGARIVWKGY